jgi:hypothetical protein
MFFPAVPSVLINGRCGAHCVVCGTLSSLPSTVLSRPPLALLLSKSYMATMHGYPCRCQQRAIQPLLFYRAVRQHGSAQPTPFRKQLRQAAQINRHRRPADMTIGDLVWLSTRHLNLAAPGKFQPKYLGPFPVTHVPMTVALAVSAIVTTLGTRHTLVQPGLLLPTRGHQWHGVPFRERFCP